MFRYCRHIVLQRPAQYDKGREQPAHGSSQLLFRFNGHIVFQIIDIGLYEFDFFKDFVIKIPAHVQIFQRAFGRQLRLYQQQQKPRCRGRLPAAERFCG